MKKKFYTLQPARGQALLSFQNRLFPKAKMELFEVEKIEEVGKNPLLFLYKDNDFKAK